MKCRVVATAAAAVDWAMETKRGVITLVQEDRFHLLGNDGVTQLFLTAHDAPLEIADLRRFEREGTPVTVSYGDAGRLRAYAAHDVVAVR